MRLGRCQKIDPGLYVVVVGKSLAVPLKHIAELGLLKSFLEPGKKSEGSDLRTQTALILRHLECHRVKKGCSLLVWMWKLTEMCRI